MRTSAAALLKRNPAPTETAVRAALDRKLCGRGSHNHIVRAVLGYTALALLVAASAVFGAVGVMGWRMGVPEPVLFWAFFFGFFAYHYAVKAAWKRLYARGVEGASTDSAGTT